MDQPALTPSEQVLSRQVGGFDFELLHRNERLVATLGAGGKLPKTRKTGTTICGAVFAGGVVLGADTRATEDSTVCDKDCAKIHYIAPNIYCCGAGTSADTENVTLLVSSNLELLRRQTGTPSRVVTSMTMLKRHLFKHQGHVSAALVLGGVDLTGAHLYTVYPHGSTDKLPFVSMGSGSLAAMAVLESGFKDDMSEAEAVALVAAAIRAGVFNDLGSGSNVDITVLRSAAATAAAAAAAAAGGAAGAAVGGGGSASASASSSSSSAAAAAAAASATAAAAAAGTTSVTIMRGYQRLNEVEAVRTASGVPRPQARNIPRGATRVISTAFTPHASR